MNQVTLYNYESTNIKISIELYFDGGKLILDGYDIGKMVEEAWGDSDYEYTLTIEPPEVEKLYVLLGINKFDEQSLLEELKKRFEGNYAYSKFGEFLTQNDIKFKPFSWT